MLFWKPCLRSSHTANSCQDSTVFALTIGIIRLLFSSQFTEKYKQTSSKLVREKHSGTKFLCRAILLERKSSYFIFGREFLLFINDKALFFHNWRIERKLQSSYRFVSIINDQQKLLSWNFNNFRSREHLNNFGIILN